jgi:hypothetical protein
MADWQDVTLTTVDLKKDYEVLDVISTVSTDGTWKEYANQLGLDIATGWLEQGTLDNLFTVVSAMLRSEAHQMGANAIVGVEFDVGTDATGFFVVGFGTAVKY